MMSNSPTSSIVECTADSGVLWRPRESSCVAPTRLWVSMQPSRRIYLLWLLSMGAMVNQWIFSYVCIPSSARSTHPPHTAWFEKRFLLFNPSNTTHTHFTPTVRKHFCLRSFMGHLVSWEKWSVPTKNWVGPQRMSASTTSLILVRSWSLIKECSLTWQ